MIGRIASRSLARQNLRQSIFSFTKYTTQLYVLFDLQRQSYGKITKHFDAQDVRLMRRRS